MFARICITLVFLILLPASNQAQDIEFVPVGERDGLNFGIHDVVQDSQGYLWVATFYSLYRYDGYNYKVYQNAPGDSTSLSASRPSALFIDHEGTLWVGTYGGLNRYDPITDSFTRYLHHPENENSLIDNNVEVIYEAPSEPGILWIGTQRGLDRLDVNKGTFTHFVHDPDNPSSLNNNQVSVILEDSEQTLWVASKGALFQTNVGGLHRLNRADYSFDRYLHSPEDTSTLINNSVLSLHEDRNGILWIGTKGDGLHQYDERNDSFIRFDFGKNHPSKPSKPHLISEDKRPRNAELFPGVYQKGVSFIHEDIKGRLWIGGFREGINVYDPEHKKQTHFESQSDSPGSLGSDRVWEIFEDREGTIWIATWNGLYKVIEKSLSLDISERYSGPNNPQNGFVDDLIEAQSGRIWIPMKHGDSGVAIYDPQSRELTYLAHNPENLNSLSSNIIFALTQDREGYIWLGTLGGGLNRYDPSSDQIHHYRYDPEDNQSIISDVISAAYEDKRGRLWIATTRGISLFNRKENTFINYSLDPSKPVEEVSYLIFSITDDLEGDVYVGALGSVFQLDPSTGVVTPMLSGHTGLFNVFRDQNNGVWALHMPSGTSDVSNFTSLFKLDSSNNTFEPYLKGETPAVSLLSREGHLWIGTTNSGLIKFNTETSVVTRFTTANGLADNSISSLIEDQRGDLWIGTVGGLSRLSRQNNSITNFYEEDGLPMNGFGLNRALLASDGSLFWGLDDYYQKGALVSFHPDNIQESVHVPTVVFSDLRIDNESVSFGENSPLQIPINVSKNIQLKSTQNSFAIDYAGIHFLKPESNSYRYILEGHEENWTEAQNVRTARYTKVPPGHYIFKVLAASSEGVWMSEPASIDIRVLPPWYRTFWAFGVYGLLFVVGVVGVDRFQRRRLIAKERLRAEREKAQAIASTNTELERALKHLTETQDQLIHTEKMASLGQLTAGVAHEIKNPLNFINNFAQICSGQAEEIEEVLEKYQGKLDTEDAHELKSILDDLKVNTTKINEHGHRADGIIRSMLEHSRANPGEKRPVDINKLLDEYVNLSYHAVRARTQGDEVTITRDYAEDLPRVEVVPQELGRVFINLLDNAFYSLNQQQTTNNKQRTKFDPEVIVSTQKNGKDIEIKIEDNGIGIPKEIQKKIFEPFFTTKPTGSGTGLGLSLSYDIVTQGHGGSLSVESEEGEGAVFVIRLPA